MRASILGTAGHVDHGKTALVRALTGVDTDRLKEEKARGITIELGFAPLEIPGRLRFGVVDVPGHQDFVRTMVAGAAGMDVVLLVVAADEGVMPQTREHVAIAQLLGIRELVVALTKSDLVDEDWLGLVDADVAGFLAATPYAHARRVVTSATRLIGLEELAEALAECGERAQAHDADDIARLPLDRIFAMQGTGTVVTGTLWSGTVRSGDRVFVLPQGLEARIRGVQVHGRDVEQARAGERTAVAISGEGADRDRVERGATLVTTREWPTTRMLTTRVWMLPDSEWSLEPRQRVRVHHGTAEVLARCSLLDADEISPGESGWVQLRLEAPLAARSRDRIVLRSYSPEATIGGAIVAEPVAPKRASVDAGTSAALARVIDGPPLEALRGALELAGMAGVPRAQLPILTGLSPSVIASALTDVEAEGAASSQRVFGVAARAEGERLVLRALEDGHARHPLRSSVALAQVRDGFPRWAAPDLADAIVQGMVREGRVESVDGGLRRPDHRPTLSEEQESASRHLEEIFRAGGLGAPALAELPDELQRREDLWELLRHLESRGVVRQVADDLFLRSDDLDEAAARIRAELGGRTELGPAAFRDVLPASRKRLLPLLSYFDGRGTTVRRGDGRDVPGS
ncbi:MAG: selenocysteine-specific translation elongation factor [Gemmatimonadales bacterium]